MGASKRRFGEHHWNIVVQSIREKKREKGTKGKIGDEFPERLTN